MLSCRGGETHSGGYQERRHAISKARFTGVIRTSAQCSVPRERKEGHKRARESAGVDYARKTTARTRVGKQFPAHEASELEQRENTCQARECCKAAFEGVCVCRGQQRCYVCISLETKKHEARAK